MGLAKYFDKLDIFVNMMKDKLKLREHKYQYEKGIPYLVKLHFIDEIAELFMLNSMDKNLLFNLLNSKDIDTDECIDVANMSFSLYYTYVFKEGL